MAITDRRSGTASGASTTDRLGGVPDGIAVKAPVRAATTASITLSGLQTIDGVVLAADDRVLVKDQTTQSENGIYDAGSGNWSRSADCSRNGDVVRGTRVYVNQGTANASQEFVVTTADPITIDSSSIVFGNASSLGPLTQVASQAEAEAGVINTKLMTPLRAKQAIDVAVAALRNGVSAAFDTLAEIATELALKAYASVTLTAGGGLTGGGDLAANRSFVVGAGTGITVNADDVALDVGSQRNRLHPSSTTDNRLVRIDGTNGDIQESMVGVDDTGNVSGVVNHASTGYHELSEIASPSSPAADKLRVFAKDVGGATHLLTRDSGGTEVDLTAATAVNPFGSALLHVRDEKASGTDGGTFTSAAWRTRTLNTTKTNEISGASLGSNQITLPAGTYWIEASAPAREVDAHKLKLANITATSDIIIGTTEFANAGGQVATRSSLDGRFTLAGTTVLQIQHMCATSKTTTGFGSAASLSVVEVYADVKIWKLS